MITESPRIFIGLAEIAGYNRNLAAGFAKLGVAAVHVALADHPFRYSESQKDHYWIRLTRYFGQKRSMAKYFPLIFLWQILFCLFKLPVFIWAIFSYDVFIFGAKTSFYNTYELVLLKALSKQIVYVFFGSDSRPPYLNGRNSQLLTEECIDLTKQQKLSLRRIEKYADFIINHPPTAHFHTRKFIPFMRMGLPFSTLSPVGTVVTQSQSVRILHAPSDPVTKGTDLIRQAIAKLRTEGFHIDYIEIIGMTNAVVLAELAQCDFVIDELYSDAAMAMFATEAAFFAKPAIVGGYATCDDWGDIPPEAVPPVMHCQAENFEDAVRKLLLDVDYRAKLGEEARKFVFRYWTAEEVAGRYLRLIRGEIPESWFYDPHNVQYLHGWGMSEGKAREMVRNMIAVGGRHSLQLDDKPHLAELFAQFSVRGEHLA